jgi:FKBP-type peptidyl-prolyl cis-trans isomerase FklB
MNVLRFTVFIFLYPIITNVYAVKIETDLEKLSYSMGIFLGQSVNRQEMEVDIPAFMQAVEDVLNNSEKKLTDDEMQKIINTYQKKEQEQPVTESDNNKLNGENFLADNKTKDGVVVLPSGLQYKIIKNSIGKKPTANGKVVVHYRGTLIDGTEFDSSYARGKPIELNLNQVIKGWQEALQLMAIGSKWQIIIPSELAYGERGAGRAIGPNATLIFDIELLNIK